jgi:hypothetical protein
MPVVISDRIVRRVCLDDLRASSAKVGFKPLVPIIVSKRELEPVHSRACFVCEKILIVRDGVVCEGEPSDDAENACRMEEVEAAH